MLRNRCVLLIVSLLVTGCGIAPGSISSTPFVITSTLAPTIVPSATLTRIPATATSTTTPVDGMTATQVNVRATPSTAGAQLGILPPFVKIQIVGQDPDAGWYEIMYPQSPTGTGWVTAQYINVITGKDKIPVIGGVPTTLPAETGTPGSSASAVVMQQVNVRNGPGTSFDALGTLNPPDVVTLTGKDPSGAWFQVPYTGAPGGYGWIAADFVKATGAENLPIVGAAGGAAVGTNAPAPTPAALTPTPGAALPDGDSAQSPGAHAEFSSAGSVALIYSSDLSAPVGDSEDWVQFTADNSAVLLSLRCTGNSDLQTDLLHGGVSIPDQQELRCGETHTSNVAVGETYLMHLFVASGPVPTYTRYTLRIADTG